MCTFDLKHFSVCTSTRWPWVADPHSTSWDNDQGCGHSDAATCFPIPQRHGRPLCRADMQFIDCSFFPFRCAVLSCNRGRIGQKGPNRFKPGAKSSRMAILSVGIAGADSGTSYFVGCRSEKGCVMLFQQAATFYQGSEEP